MTIFTFGLTDGWHLNNTPLLRGVVHVRRMRKEHGQQLSRVFEETVVGYLGRYGGPEELQDHEGKHRLFRRFKLACAPSYHGMKSCHCRREVTEGTKMAEQAAAQQLIRT
mmetsp:Transcript_6387/g.13898  ORF Transcript_6387/g.13898 Transcript_6387/m.13898 type:complete len:110 (-) Transcript_6387:1164-1493(-)